MTSNTPDPFDLARQMLAAQQAQLDLAESMMRQMRDMAAWQARALEAASSLARSQRQWLSLWGMG